MGATEGTGPVHGVGGGDGEGICGGAQDDSAWSSGRGATDLENIGHRGRAVDISHGLPGQGRPAEMPVGGTTRPINDKDGDAGPFPTPACPGHRVHSGGGKPTPLTVPPMGHSGPLAGIERQAPCHRSVSRGRGEKEAAASGGGSEGETGEGL